jgi:hypothetical protein
LYLKLKMRTQNILSRLSLMEVLVKFNNIGK